jgi:hypothetical protein
MHTYETDCFCAQTNWGSPWTQQPRTEHSYTCAWCVYIIDKICLSLSVNGFAFCALGLQNNHDRHILYISRTAYMPISSVHTPTESMACKATCGKAHSVLSLTRSQWTCRLMAPFCHAVLASLRFAHARNSRFCPLSDADLYTFAFVYTCTHVCFFL